MVSALPVLEVLTVSDPSRTVLVDVGGGLGHALAVLRDHYPDVQYRMIVQDRPAVIKDVKVSHTREAQYGADLPILKRPHIPKRSSCLGSSRGLCLTNTISISVIAE